MWNQLEILLDVSVNYNPLWFLAISIFHMQFLPLCFLNFTLKNEIKFRIRWRVKMQRANIFHGLLEVLYFMQNLITAILIFTLDIILWKIFFEFNKGVSFFSKWGKHLHAKNECMNFRSSLVNVFILSPKTFHSFLFGYFLKK